MDNFMKNNDLGFYMIRTCGQGYEYCNGMCDRCYKSHYNSTAHTISIREMYQETPNGTPIYKVKRNTEGLSS